MGLFRHNVCIQGYYTEGAMHLRVSNAGAYMVQCQSFWTPAASNHGRCFGINKSWDIQPQELAEQYNVIMGEDLPSA